MRSGQIEPCQGRGREQVVDWDSGLEEVIVDVFNSRPLVPLLQDQVLTRSCNSYTLDDT